MRKILFILFIAFLFSCENNTEETTTEKELTQEEIDIAETLANAERDAILEEMEEEEGLIYTGFDGVFIAKTLAYELPNFNQESFYDYPSASFIMIEKKGDRMPLDISREDECYRYGYNWYSVSEGVDIPMWVYGENLYLRSSAKESLNNNMSSAEMDFGYKVNDKFYRFDMASHSWDSPENPDGYPYCYGYGFPFMYQDGNPNVFPIIIGKGVGELGFIFSSTQDNYLLILLDSDGGGANIDDFIEIEEGKYKIKLSIGYQDGGEDAVLHILEKNGQFVLTHIEMMGVKYG